MGDSVSLTVVSLFDGIGGFCRAFENAGAQVVATVEIDKAAAAVSHRHFPNAKQFHDVAEVDADDPADLGVRDAIRITSTRFTCRVYPNNQERRPRSSGITCSYSGLRARIEWLFD